VIPGRHPRNSFRVIDGGKHPEPVVEKIEAPIGLIMAGWVALVWAGTVGVVWGAYGIARLTGLVKP
jgi:hypothetical protein